MNNFEPKKFSFKQNPVVFIVNLQIWKRTIYLLAE